MAQKKKQNKAKKIIIIKNKTKIIIKETNATMRDGGEKKTSVLSYTVPTAPIKILLLFTYNSCIKQQQQ